MVWFAVIAIIGVVIFFFLGDRDKMLEHQVDSKGGMQQKYNEVINWILADPGAKVANISRGQIHIIYRSTTTSTDFFITEVFNGTEVEWQTDLGIMGKHSKKWHFRQEETQIQMIQRIGKDLKMLEQKLFSTDSYPTQKKSETELSETEYLMLEAFKAIENKEGNIARLFAKTAYNLDALNVTANLLYLDTLMDMDKKLSLAQLLENKKECLEVYNAFKDKVSNKTILLTDKEKAKYSDTLNKMGAFFDYVVDVEYEMRIRPYRIS